MKNMVVLASGDIFRLEFLLHHPQLAGGGSTDHLGKADHSLSGHCGGGGRGLTNKGGG